MQRDTQRGAELLLAGLIAAVAHALWLGQGRDTLTMILGFTVTTGILWWMLALRTVANGGAIGAEVADGWASMAATAWAFAVVPPRAGNFLPVPAVDDFSRLYLPLCLAPVFVVLAAQKLFPGVFWKRFVFGAGGTLGCAALLLLTLAAGEQSGALALRCGLVGLGLLAASMTPVRSGAK